MRIHVAKLAGIPGQILQRAHEILERLERDATRHDLGGDATGPRQLDLFRAPKTNPLVLALRSLDPDHMTPVDALQKLCELRDEFCR